MPSLVDDAIRFPGRSQPERKRGSALGYCASAEETSASAPLPAGFFAAASSPAAALTPCGPRVGTRAPSQADKPCKINEYYRSAPHSVILRLRTDAIETPDDVSPLGIAEIGEPGGEGIGLQRNPCGIGQICTAVHHHDPAAGPVDIEAKPV